MNIIVRCIIIKKGQLINFSTEKQPQATAFFIKYLG